MPFTQVTVEGGLREPEATTWSAIARQQHSIAFVDVSPRDTSDTAQMRLRSLATNGTLLDSLTPECQRG